MNKLFFILPLLLAACNETSTDPPVDSGVVTTDAKEYVGLLCEVATDCLAGLICADIDGVGVCTFECAPLDRPCDISGVCTRVGNRNYCL